jgi:putative RecB family exonuclease
MVKRYSHSKITMFEQCALKYKFRYIDKIIPEIKDTIETHLGGCVHSVLEWLYSQIKEQPIPTIDEVIVKYTQVWEQNYKPEFIVVKDYLTVKDYFNKGVEFLVTYYMQNKPFDDNTIELEKEVIITLDSEEGYQIQGFIDRLVYNLKSKEYEIHDYKTANSMPSQEKIDTDKQLALYALGIKEEFGQEKRVKLIWHYLAHNKRIEIKKTNVELEEIKKETIQLIKKIEGTKEFLSNKSRLCDWCGYKNICPAWGNSPQNPKIEPKEKYPTISKYIKDKI